MKDTESDIINFWNNLSEEQKKDLSERQRKESELDYQNFKTQFLKGKCYLCNQDLDKYSDSPCLHWLVVPDCKSKKIEEFLMGGHQNFYQIQSYLRWVANQERLFGNINNLKSEIPKGKIVETTITYQDFEWTLSISEEDIKGHSKSKNSNFPHYHFQLRKDGNVRIKDNKFHIPLTEDDLFTLKSERRGFMSWRDMGAGMQEALEMREEGILEEALSITDDPEKASFDTSYCLISTDGKGISEDEIVEILKEQKETEKPLSQLLHKLSGEHSQMAIHSAAESVPDIAERKNPRKKQNK